MASQSTINSAWLPNQQEASWSPRRTHLPRLHAYVVDNAGPPTASTIQDSETFKGGGAYQVTNKLFGALTTTIPTLSEKHISPQHVGGTLSIFSYYISIRLKFTLRSANVGVWEIYNDGMNDIRPSCAYQVYVTWLVATSPISFPTFSPLLKILSRCFDLASLTYQVNSPHYMTFALLSL